MSNGRDNGNRELLSQAIIEVLAAWPDLQRRVFIEAHYESRTPEQIAESIGFTVNDVRRLLDLCSTRLNKALKSYRASDPHPGLDEVSVEAPLSV